MTRFSTVPRKGRVAPAQGSSATPAPVSAGPRRALLAARLVIVVAAYYGSARLGLSLAHQNSSITAVWAPTGIALAALVLWGFRMWPAVVVGAFLANMLPGADLGLLTVLGITAGNTLEALTGAFLLRLARFRPSMERVRDVLALVGCAALVSTAVSATVGVTSLHLGGALPGSAVPSAWELWWLGDLGGDLLVAPLLFVLATAKWPANVRRPLAEAGVGAGLGIGLSYLIFAHDLPIGYLVFPYLILGALRLGQLGAVVSSFVVAAVAISQTAHDQGPFAGTALDTSLLLTQTFVAAGAVTALVLAAVTTERRHSQERLKQAHDVLEQRVRDRTTTIELRERQLAEAQGLAQVGSWHWDLASNRLTCSEEFLRIHGLDTGSREVTFETLFDLCDDDDRPAVRECIAAAIDTGRPFTIDLRIRRRDGALRWLHARGEVIPGDAGPIGVRGTSQDITERKDVDRLKDEFIATVSHELRTPLASIAAYLEALTSGELGPVTGEQEEFLGVVERNAGRLGRLVDDLLFVAQVDAGRLTFRREITDLRAVAKQCVDEMRPLADRQGVEVRLTAADMPPVIADAVRIGQLLDNLVSNAIKFTPDGGRVDVRVGAGEEDVVLIEVTDTGMGIPPEEQERLFDRFYRTASATRQSIRGTGLGLAIVKAIVEGHAGEITCTSEEGAGTTFAVRLPRPEIHTDHHRRQEVLTT